MYTDQEDLVHEIYRRHLRSLAIAGGKNDSLSLPIASVRLVLHLALSELADRMAQPQPEQPIAVASAAPAAVVTVDSDSEQPKRRGRLPGTKNKQPYQRKGLADDIAHHVANGATLVTDDAPIVLEGVRERTEQVVHVANGVPMATTRVYTELR